MGATAGRTTLTGEGLQHDDGHSQVLASTVPNVRAYDPAYAYELAAIVRDGIERMFVRGEDVFYYVTLYNENYPMPKKPDGVDEGIIRGIYRLFAGARRAVRAQARVRLVGSGSILQQVVAAQQLLAEKFGVAAEVYSAPSFQPAPARGARDRTLEPAAPGRAAARALRRQVLGPDGGPIVAATDWIRTVPDLCRAGCPDRYVTLGTDGFGRSDTRESLRAFFEIDPPSIAAATLAALARCGAMSGRKAAKAILELGVDPERTEPFAV